MRIESVETLTIQLPLCKDYRWASLNIPLGNWVIVRIRANNGLVGYGESTSLPDWGGDFQRHHGETPATTSLILREQLGPALCGQDPTELERLHALMDRLARGFPYTKAAIDIALHDLIGRHLGVPVSTLLGGRFRAAVPVAHMIGLMPVDDAAAEARAVVEDGVAMVQVKGGLDPERDLEVVRRIREAVGSRMRLWLDANQGHPGAKEAIRTIRRMQAYGLEMIEQPVEGLRAMAAVTRAVEAVVLADESAWSATNALDLVRQEAADAVSIYLAKAGGLYRAKQVAAVVEAAGCPPKSTARSSRGLAPRPTSTFAAATRVVSYPCVISVSVPAGGAGPALAGRYYTDDVIAQPLPFRAGALLPPAGPGLGIEVDEAKLERYRVA